MINLSQTLQHYPGENFKSALKQAIEQCDRSLLPLDKGTAQGGYVSDEPITATVLRVLDCNDNIQADVGVFFTEIVICCGCGDDPMPVNTYCELRLLINKQSAEAIIDVLNT